jgi:predicted RNase H-like nuclease (RuvC/YqgF family)
MIDKDEEKDKSLLQAKKDGENKKQTFENQMDRLQNQMKEQYDAYQREFARLKEIVASQKKEIEKFKEQEKQLKYDLNEAERYIARQHAKNDELRKSAGNAKISMESNKLNLSEQKTMAELRFKNLNIRLQKEIEQLNSAKEKIVILTQKHTTSSLKLKEVTE